MINKKKPQHGKLEMDLLAMALAAQRAREERKRSAPPLQSVPEPAPTRIGKVLGAGELARRKNRLSSLKKSILRERKARFHLQYPESMPIPLQNHPSLQGLDCVWLDNNQDDPLPDAATTSPVFFGCYFQSSPLAPSSSIHTVVEEVPSPKQQTSSHIPFVRDYVTQALSLQLDNLLASMLEKLFRFQERARMEDPIKAKSKRRLVLGLREVRKAVKTKKCIAIIVAPNIESLELLDNKVTEILTLCSDNPTRLEFELPIPILYTGMSMLKLGKSMGISRPISIVGLFNADGAHEEFKLAIGLANKLTEFWQLQLQAELVLATNRGTRPWCWNCSCLLLEEMRRICLDCLATYCQSCCDSLQAKQVLCVKSQVGCQMVRLFRTLPVLGAKPKLTPHAGEYIPPSWKSHKPLSKLATVYVPL
ncbi:hypothetical protein BASA81_003179 [Batrachochytrium salamandrivorans]|nr:hypothetical protein BASA81_003179 [Batrachochytrium salamandrivorans]